MHSKQERPRVKEPAERHCFQRTQRARENKCDKSAHNPATHTHTRTHIERFATPATAPGSEHKRSPPSRGSVPLHGCRLVPGRRAANLTLPQKEV